MSSARLRSPMTEDAPVAALLIFAPKQIGQDIGSGYDQTALAGGYDHNSR